MSLAALRSSHTDSVTSSLLMPRRRGDADGQASNVNGSTAPTYVLDWQSPVVAELAGTLGEAADRDWLRQAHSAIAARIRPVYALNDLQAASKTIRRGRGSCSQRLAVLETLARRHGIPTRVEGIAVDGRFWYPRFSCTPWLVPHRVILAWPEFRIAGRWVPAGELFGSHDVPTRAFTNDGDETLYDAIGRTGVSWSGSCSDGACDLSGHVLETLGYFDHRDELFARHGQTLCLTARTLGEPLMAHRSAGAR